MERSRRSGTAALGAVLSAFMVLAVTVAPAAWALAPSVASVRDVTVTEGSGGTTSATFTVTLSESNGTTTVTYTTVNGTAMAGEDYTATSGTLTFLRNELTKTVTVPITTDLLDEADETFAFTLTTIDNGTFQGGDPNAVGTIVDDDPTPSLSISDAAVTEGNTDTVTTTVTVTLSAPSGRNVAVDFATADGTATFSPGADYHSQSGRLVFAPGETTKTITLTVVSDTVNEPDEAFFVNLTNPVNATIADPRATITIANDDQGGQSPPPGGGSTPAISITDATVTEGNGGTVQTTVRVSLSRASTDHIGVDFATADNTATFSGSDYHSQSGRLVFAPGETSKTITLTIVGDTVDENNESFFVNLSAPVNATIGDGQSVVTIIDDDTGTTPPPPPPSGALPSIIVSDATVAEGSNGDTRVSVTVSLSAASTAYVTVDFATADGTATFSGADYWRMSGRLVFAPGETSRTLTATVVGDVTDEANEVFYIDLSNATNATLSDARAAITILDDDGATTPPPGGPPAISITDAAVQEGNADTTRTTLTLTLSQASSNPVSVDVATSDGTASFNEGDYYSVAGRLVFQPGETTDTLQITVNGDTLAERDEVFYVNLTNPVNATIADARSEITIADDDAPAETTTTLTVVQKTRRLVATGSVMPPHPGDRMRVVLKKRRDGRFHTIEVNRPLLGDALDRDGDAVFESDYRTDFKRPRAGICLLKAVFPGDADHAKSVARGRFRC